MRSPGWKFSGQVNTSCIWSMGFPSLMVITVRIEMVFRLFFGFAVIRSSVHSLGCICSVGIACIVMFCVDFGWT